MAANLYFKDKITKLYSHSLRKSGRCCCVFLNHLQYFYCVFFCSFWTLSAILRVWKQLFKKPNSATKKTSLSIIFNSFTTAFDSTSLDLVATIHQKLPLSNQKCELCDTMLIHCNYETLKMVCPDNVLQYIWKPKKPTYHQSPTCKLFLLCSCLAMATGKSGQIS